MRRLALAALVLGVTASTTGAGYAVDGGHAERAAPGLVTVTVDIRYSHFSIGELRIPQGTMVRFVVRNHDPIAHELIVGDASVQARHEVGHEASHPPVPGEVSVGPDDTGVTVYRFDHPGGIEYACHLPGHDAYGMHGRITVTPSS